VSAEVAAPDEPFIVCSMTTLRAESGRGRWEDADDVCAAADLAVDPLERIGRAQLRPVVGGEGVEGEQVLLGVLDQRSDLR
jgi:hypothetical protein